MVLDKKYEEYLGQGEVYLGYGKLEDAEKCFKQVLVDYPTNWFALNKMGVIQGKKGQLSEALKFFKKAMANAEEKTSIYCNIGNVYLQQKDFDQAIKYYNMAAKENQDNYIPMKNLAVAYKRKGNLKEFYHYAKKARMLEKRYAKVKGFESNLEHILGMINKKEGIPLTFIFMLLIIIVLLVILLIMK